MQSFTPLQSALLAATTAAQSIALPTQAFSSVVVHNTGTGTAYLALGNGIAIPGATFASPGVMVVGAGTTQTFLARGWEGQTLSYIASVAGPLDVSVGTGV
jgi:hypothetical protein